MHSVKIYESRVLRHINVILLILKNTPVLDPLVILLNSKIYYLKKNNKIISFVSIKKFGKNYELGTVFTETTERKKGYANLLINHVLSEHKNISLLCKEELEIFYNKFNFEKSFDCSFVVNLRRKLFNNFLFPILGYKLISMKYKY